MGHPQIPSSAPHLYSQGVQLKLYQAFIFSIPIIFSIILFLLFYLFFYLKRTASSSSPQPTPLLPTTTLNLEGLCEMGSVNGISLMKDKLLLVLFDQVLNLKDSQCCVCLGEFEIQEELHQIPSCRHVFHIDCISHWLHSNSTCPLCRGCVITSTHLDAPPPIEPDHDPHIPSLQLELELEHHSLSLGLGGDMNFATCSREEHVIMIEESSGNSAQPYLGLDLGDGAIAP